MDLTVPGLNFESVEEYGQRAVSFGAADADLPSFREFTKIGRDPGPPGIERFPAKGV